MTPSVVELREYQSREVALSDETARRLATHAPTAVTVQPSSTSGRWWITAAGQVGTIAVPGLRLLIRPKIRIENVFTLLDAGLPANAWRHDDARLATDHGLLPAFADFFARSVEQATKRGLLRTYREQREALIAPRGRIDFPTQLRTAVLPSPLTCLFDEYTADVLENRLLLGTVERLLGLVELAPATRVLLRSLRARFEDVALMRPHTTDFDRLTITRLSEHYRAPLRLAQLIAENLTLLDRHGTATVSSFLLDMPRLFQAFVTRRLTSVLRGTLTVVPEPPLRLDEEQQVPVRPDLVFMQGSSAVYVGDAKYKLAPKGRAGSSDFYQLLAYCQALDLREGVLVYAQADGQPPSKLVTVRHSGVRLWTYRLDLSGPPDQLQRNVTELADWISEASDASLAV